MSIYVLAQNGVRYVEPVHDPYFQADNETLKEEFSDGFYWVSNSLTRSIGCIDQYRICNPMTQDCTAFGGANQLFDAADLELNPAQFYTLLPFIRAASASFTFFNVYGLNSGGKLTSIPSYER